MLGLKIFVHSLRMVLRNWREALRIFLVPNLAIGLLAFVILGSGGKPISGLAAVLATVVALAWVYILFWCIVSWHRFVLLEEMPQGWNPPARFDRVLAYVGRGFLLALIISACVIPFGFLVVPAMSIVPLAVLQIITMALTVGVAVLGFRLVAILPAAAIGTPLKMGDAFRATSGATGTLLVLVLISGAVSYLIDLTAPALISVSPAVGTVLYLLVYSIMAVVNISILTTIFGHYVEGRSID